MFPWPIPSFYKTSKKCNSCIICYDSCRCHHCPSIDRIVSLQFFAKLSSLWGIDVSKKFLFYFKKGSKRGPSSEILYIWNVYKFNNSSKTKYSGSSILLCPTHYYCVRQNTVSTLAVNIHLFDFPLLTCFSGIYIMLHSA